MYIYIWIFRASLSVLVTSMSSPRVCSTEAPRFPAFICEQAPGLLRRFPPFPLSSTTPPLKLTRTEFDVSCMLLSPPKKQVEFQVSTYSNKNFTVTIQTIWAQIQYRTLLYGCTDKPNMEFTGCRLKSLQEESCLSQECPLNLAKDKQVRLGIPVSRAFFPLSGPSLCQDVSLSLFLSISLARFFSPHMQWHTSSDRGVALAWALAHRLDYNAIYMILRDGFD